MDQKKIAIIGLGYVGLPLAVEFAKQRSVIGFDIDTRRIQELCGGVDRTMEFDAADLEASTGLMLTSNQGDLSGANFYIVTVPTPIDANKKPDLSYLVSASELVGAHLKSGDIVVYESTVYPGCTEEVCVDVLERVSGLKFNHDFFCGYSPERINPGDKTRRLKNIVKVTSGSNPVVAKVIDELYGEIIEAGTFLVDSIKIAEASKIIENTQRDVNIAFMNELSMIFDHLGIDTKSVLDAAATKWNFLPFSPGLVGGHCISVDPYYLASKAESMGYIPDIINTSRRLNDSMPKIVIEKLLREMNLKGIPVRSAKILVMGVTFKENCPDLRNSKVRNIIEELRKYTGKIDVFDDVAYRDELKSFTMVDNPDNNHYDAVLICVPHQKIIDIGVKAIRKLCSPAGIIFDLKSVFPPNSTDLRL